MPLSTMNTCLFVFASPLPGPGPGSEHALRKYLKVATLTYPKSSVPAYLTVPPAPAGEGPEAGPEGSQEAWPNSSTGLQIHTVLRHWSARQGLEEMGQQPFSQQHEAAWWHIRRRVGCWAVANPPTVVTTEHCESPGKRGEGSRQEHPSPSASDCRNHLTHWFPSRGTRTPGGTGWAVRGYAKKIISDGKKTNRVKKYKTLVMEQ